MAEAFWLTEKMAITACSIYLVRQGPPQAVMFLSRAVKDKAQNRSNGVAGKTCPHHQSAQLSRSSKTSHRRFFGSSRYGVGFGRSTSLIFW